MTRQPARLSFVAACFLVALSRIAACQNLQPRLETIPSPAPVGDPFYAIVSLPANPAAIGFYFTYDNLKIEGNLITAVFDSGCGFICPGGGLFYTGFPLPMPALKAGHYQLMVVDAAFPAYTWATLPLTIGPGQAPALVTHPSNPAANQTFNAEFWITAHPDDPGIDPQPSVSGNLITVGFDGYSYCASTCPEGLTYRSFPVSFPALASGTYDVRFVASYVYSIYPPMPPLPPVAEFSLTIGAHPDPVPAMGTSTLLMVVILVIGAPWLRSRRSEQKNAADALQAVAATIVSAGSIMHAMRHNGINSVAPALSRIT